MQGTTFQRTGRVARRAFTHPLEAFAYVRDLPIWRRGPIDLRLPWFSYGAIRELQRFLKPEHDVFEFGSGGSTIFFAQRARQVKTVEHDRNWLDRVQARSKSLALNNIDFRFHPLDSVTVPDYRNGSYFAELAGAKYDLIAIDGYCGFETSRYGELRPYCFELATQAIKPGGVVVLDDSWMFPGLLAQARPGTVREFTGLGPCRYGVTSTALFCF